MGLFGNGCDLGDLDGKDTRASTDGEKLVLGSGIGFT